jgi:hypothetical protein
MSGGLELMGGLDVAKGVIGIFGAEEDMDNTAAQLEANKQLIQSEMRQNQASYYQKITANNTRMTSVLSANRSMAAGDGITMDSDTVTESMIKNLNNYDQDSLSSALNEGFVNEKLMFKENAAEQQADAQDDSDIFSMIEGFL